MNNSKGNPIGVSLDLPHKPSFDEIFYIEGNHTIKVERWRIEYFIDIISESLSAPESYINGYISLIQQIFNKPEIWGFYSDEEIEMQKREMVNPFNFKNYIQSSHIKDTPKICILSSKHRDRYQFMSFEVRENNLIDILKDVFAYMDQEDNNLADEYESNAEYPAQKESLLLQLQKCVRLLQELGMEKAEIEENLYESKCILPLTVTENWDIMVGYHIKSGEINMNYTKIRLAPLDKAIYLLFLRHPEGINFSYLPDYRNELMEIYKKMMPYRTTANMLKSIEDVTDPTQNSINEKCARIKRAFVEHFGNYRANTYCITGQRGDVKKIVLDRAFVYWESSPENQ